MNVHVTVELEQLVHAKVQSGRSNSASEVVREALRLTEQRDEVRPIQLQELRNRMDRALGESARGEGTDTYTACSMNWTRRIGARMDGPLPTHARG